MQHNITYSDSIVTSPSEPIQLSVQTAQTASPADLLLNTGIQSHNINRSQSTETFPLRFSAPILKDYNLNEIVGRATPEPHLIREVLNALCEIDNIELTQRPTIVVRHRNVVGVLSTKNDDFFFKLCDAQAGYNEFIRGESFGKFATVIRAHTIVRQGNFSLLLQPFQRELFEGRGMLSTLLLTWELNPASDKSSEFAGMFNEILSTMRDLHNNSMQYQINSANNDVFFHDRLQPGGRVESHYQNAQFQIGNQTLSWGQLRKAAVIVDGVSYQETLDDLLIRAAERLHPANPRLLSFCHGDSVDTNIFTNGLSKSHKSEHVFGFFDLETAGTNSTLADMTSFLVHLTTMGGYTSPKYLKKQLSLQKDTMELLSQLGSPVPGFGSATISQNGSIEIANVLPFGIHPLRKLLAQQTVEGLVRPVLENACNKFGDHLMSQFKQDLQSLILMRLMGVHNFSHYDPNDQLRILASLFKVCATPCTAPAQDPLTNFLSIL